MGKLIDPDRRARAKKAAVERRRRILEEARWMLERLPVHEVDLDSVARRADVEAGLASMYFGSFQELVLAIRREELGAWYDAVEETVRRESADGPDGFAAAVAEDLSRRTLLLRLLAASAHLLEGAVESAAVMGQVRWTAARLRAVGQLMDGRFRLRAPGTGCAALYRLQLVAAALAPAALPRGPLAVALQDPEAEPLRLDLQDELTRFLRRALEDDPGGDG